MSLYVEVINGHFEDETKYRRFIYNPKEKLQNKNNKARTICIKMHNNHLD